MDDELADRIARSADAEEISEADYLRKVVKLIQDQYEAAGSLHSLKQTAILAAAALRKVTRSA